LDKQCGIVVDSLHDLQKILDELTLQDYNELLDNARHVGVALREGAYLKAALMKLK
jgi:putative galactofuranose transferase